MVFYPDNIPRRDRALQLQGDISVLQQSAAEAEKALKKEDERMLPLINQVLKAHGMSSFDELKAKLDAALTEEQKKKYKDLCDTASKLSTGADTGLMAMSAIAFTSGILAKTLDIGIFLRACNIVTVFRAYTRAFITFVTKGVEAGMKAFRAVSAVFKWTTESFKDASKLARYAGNVSRFLKVLSIASIFGDAFILAFDYFEQKAQCEALQDAIKKLFVARIVVKVFSRMCDAIKTQDGLMMSYLIVIGDDPVVDPDDQRAADKIANKFIAFVKDDWSEIDTASSLDLLILMDAHRGSWTTDDPRTDDAIKDANDQINHDPPKKGNADLASCAALQETIRVAHADFDPPPVYEAVGGLLHLDGVHKAWVKDVIVPNMV